jgi:hypothetical protein
MTFIIGTPFARGAGYSSERYSAESGAVCDDVHTCPHCQAIIKMRQWRKVENGGMAGGFCTKCNAPVCGHCNRKMVNEGCVPFLARIDRELDAVVKLRAYQMMAGLEPASPPPRIFTGVNQE